VVHSNNAYYIHSVADYGTYLIARVLEEHGSLDTRKNRGRELTGKNAYHRSTSSRPGLFKRWIKLSI